MKKIIPLILLFTSPILCFAQEAALPILQDAKEYIDKGQLDKAEEIYEEGLKDFPESALLWASLAGNALDQGKIDETIEYCNRALSYDSCNPNAHFILGLTSSMKGDEEHAIVKFQETIKCEPSFALAYFDLGVSYISKQEYSKAIDEWVKATQVDKTGGMGTQIENTINGYVQNASSSNMFIQYTDSSKPWILLPTLEISQKSIFESLLTEYTVKLQLNEQPKFDYYINIGGLNYYSRGNLDAALKNIKTGLDMLIEDKDLPEDEKQNYLNYTYRILGDIYIHKMEFELAQENYNQALRINSEDANALAGLGITNTVKGDFNKAEEIYGKILSIDPNSSFANEALRLLLNKNN